MRDLIQRLDFWLTIGALAFAIMLEYDRIRAWLGRRSVSRFDQRRDDVMSRSPDSRPVPAGSGTGSADLVPGQQHQREPAAPANFDDVLAYLARHKLESPDQVVDVLSVLQFGDGHVLSANKIRDVVGGNERAVKARVASHRPKDKEEAPRTSSRLERPENGWG